MRLTIGPHDAQSPSGAGEGVALGANQVTSIARAVWCPDTFVTRLGGDVLLARELVALFLVECPGMLAAVRDSVENGSADDLRRTAHFLKGSMCNFTDRAPVTTAFALEQQGAAGRLTDAPAMLAQLELEMADLVAAMRQFEGA